MSIQRIINLEHQANDFGFSWPKLGHILDQISSECDEIKEVAHDPLKRAHLKEEIGDLMSAIISLCVFLDFDPEEILDQNAQKLQGRLNALFEICARENMTTLKGQNFETLMEYWRQAKLETQSPL